MRIDCPGCGAAYDVATVHLRPGRAVCCARCDLHWQVGATSEPPPIAAVRAASVVLRPSAVRAPPPIQPAQSVARHADAPVWEIGWEIGWAASVLLLAGLLAGAAHWSGAIMHGWPPSARLYVALGVARPER